MSNICAILNVGLDWTDADGTKRERPVWEALHVTEKHVVRVIQTAVHRSETENTLVVRCVIEADLWRIFELADELAQDCIAVWSIDDQAGELVGEKAREWGPFDPAKFLTLDGRPLSEALEGEG